MAADAWKNIATERSSTTLDMLIVNISTEELAARAKNGREGHNSESYLPISKTIKTILRFFDPGFTSLIKSTPSLEIFDISES